MSNFGKTYQFFLSLLLGLLIWAGTNTTTVAQISATKLCLSECQDSTAATQFKDTFSTPATAWLWDFGDPTSGNKNTSTLKSPAHLYTTPGKKTITLTRTEAGVPKVYTTEITINQPPTPFYLGNDPSQQDTTICKGDKLKLDPYRTGGALPQYKYSWFPKGDTTQTIFADSTTCYSVQVTDTLTGCSSENKLNVKLCVPPPPEPPKEYWYFGKGAGMLFSNGSPTADDQGKTDAIEGVSSITDAKGNTIFYTDGRKVYRKDGTLMPSVSPADTLLGSSFATQGTVIIPVPSCKGCQSLYYVFTTTDINGQKQLTYSVVDMRKDGGKGKIVEKNIPVNDAQTTESVASVYVPKDSTYWVVTHDYGNNTFRLNRVTKNGLSISKTIDIGSAVDSVSKAQGYLKFSADNTKMAYVIPGPYKNLIEIYDFADSTGTISGKRVIDLGLAPPTLYGAEFSPDGNSLYATLTADVTTLPPADTTIKSQLLKFDITTTDTATIRKSKVLIDSTSTQNFGTLKVGPDGKIYMAIQGSSFLGVIGKPNVQLQSTDKLDTLEYKRNGFDLNGKLSQLGLPNTTSVTPTQDEQSGISVSDTCLGSPTNFQANHLCGDKLKNTKTLWLVYRGKAPQNNQPEGSPIATLGGGAGDKDLQASITLTEPGVYHVRVVMANRCKSDTTLPAQEFTIKPMPSPNLGNDIELCAASTILNSNNTLDSSNYFWVKDGSFLPNDSLRTLTVTQSGKYRVLVERNGCIKDDEINVVLAQAQPFNLADTTICNSSSIILDASVAGGSNSQYRWSSGQTTPSIVVTTAGKYTVTVTTPIGNTTCTVSDDINVALRPPTNFSRLITAPTACNKQDGSIVLSNFNPADTYTFVWYKDGILQPNLTGANISGLSTGTYQVTINSPSSCGKTETFSLIPAATPLANITTRVDNVTCLSDGAININVLSTSRFIPFNYILIKQGTPDIQAGSGGMASIFVSSGIYKIKNLTTGTYIISFEDAAGCKYTTGPITINSVTRTAVTITPPASKCEGETIELEASNYSSGNIVWNTGATTPKIAVTNSGTYTVTVTSLDGICRNVANTTVTFRPSPKVTIIGPNTVCLGTSPIQLTATPAGGVWSGTNISTSGLYTPPAFIKTDAIKYQFTQNNCVGSETKNISTVSKPQVNLGNDINFCRNEIKMIGINTEPNLTYRWNTGENTAKIFPSRTGTYTLTVSNGTCNTIDDIKVNILAIPYISLKSETPICVPDGLPVQLDAGNGGGFMTYNWIPTGENTQKIAVYTPGFYTVKVTNPAGCINTATTTVYDLCIPDVIVPNIFTPNNDSKNNTFQIFVKHISRNDFTLKIYNRWGEMVFLSNDWDDRWDGKYKGVLSPPNSYVWEITYRPEYPDAGSEIKVKRGAVTVAW